MAKPRSKRCLPNTDAATTATDLSTAINADATISTLVIADASAGDGTLTLTAATPGTAFVAVSSLAVDGGNGATTVDATTTANVVANDQALFDLDEATGVLTFKAAPDFEMPIPGPTPTATIATRWSDTLTAS